MESYVQKTLGALLDRVQALEDRVGIPRYSERVARAAEELNAQPESEEWRKPIEEWYRRGIDDESVKKRQALSDYRRDERG